MSDPAERRRDEYGASQQRHVSSPTHSSGPMPARSKDDPAVPGRLAKEDDRSSGALIQERLHSRLAIQVNPEKLK